jgi:hypothetical protein
MFHHKQLTTESTKTIESMSYKQPEKEKINDLYKRKNKWSVGWRTVS